MERVTSLSSRDKAPIVTFQRISQISGQKRKVPRYVLKIAVVWSIKEWPRTGAAAQLGGVIVCHVCEPSLSLQH